MKRRVLTNYETPKRPVVHVFFIAPGCCYTGYSFSNNNSPFYMGIPRLKFPSDAPSRSTLKLEEAFHVFIPADEWDERLANGMYAVDLGACPGGWTYQLVKRNMWVSSVDNGPMAQSLMDTGQVTWLREDGFRYRPNRNNISWMVCDMVEKPAKVAALMAQWLVNGWCRETIFNLKLPMKKRYEEVSQNLAYIQAQLDEHGVNAQIQARQLYHDREEVTVHVRRLWAAVGGRSRRALISAQQPRPRISAAGDHADGKRSCCRLPSSCKSVCRRAISRQVNAISLCSSSFLRHFSCTSASRA